MTNYLSQQYGDIKRWASYWYQINEILVLKPKSVLVVGKGDGVVPVYLKTQGLNVTTLDNDKSLDPDIEASVLNMPISDIGFDAVLCAEVLEHFSYDEFDKALFEIKRVAKIGAVISLPHFGPTIKFLLKLPFFPEIKILWKLPYPRKHIFNGEHYWEIGKKGYSLRKIKSEFKKIGFSIKKDFIVFENPLHHFFVLKK
ncbi:MAG: methyltransferase domain-containing protein [Candidatus Azambacteria bacterium]|nr:methyltransferase domain-containing protein [Candidatus Azambacteria bacterium]